MVDNVRLSDHEIDVLIRQIITGQHQPSDEDRVLIVRHIVSVKFDDRPFRVPENLRIADTQSVLGERVSSFHLHYIRRVVVELQWAQTVSPADFLNDLRAAFAHESSRLGVYARRGGKIAIAVAPTNEIIPVHHLGIGTLPMLLVVYSADRGVIVSGYQFSDWSLVAIPGDVRWF